MIKEFEDKLQVYFDEEVDAAALNQALSKQGIFLNYLSKSKLSLEEQFLELTNQN